MIFKKFFYILFALRFYLAVAGLLWWLLPAQRQNAEFNIFRVTATALDFMASERDRILAEGRGIEKRNVSLATLINGRAGGRTPD